MSKDEAWSGSLHSTWRYLPEPTESLQAFLDADGAHKEDVRASMPYDVARAGATPGGMPSPKRYRDARQVYQTAGFIIERDDTVHVTPLGRALRRHIEQPSVASALLLAPHALGVLGAAQLRNPSRAGSRYAENVNVHPFHVVWRILSACDWMISSVELNRVVMRIGADEAVPEAVSRILAGRQALRVEEHPNLDAILGTPAVTGSSVNDRLIPWVSLASFGYSLIGDKDPDGYYRARPEARALLRRASAARHDHHEFDDQSEYLEFLARAAHL